MQLAKIRGSLQPRSSAPLPILHPRRPLRPTMRHGGTGTFDWYASVCFIFLFAATAASTPCSLPPAEGPGGLVVSDKALPDALAVLLPGTEMLPDFKALVARLGEREEAPFALVRTWEAVSADVNPTDLAVVRGYVKRGGLLVVMGGSGTSRLLNELFGWELVSNTPEDWWRALAGNVSGTCFDMEEIPVLNRGEASQHFEPTSLSSLPPEARSIYSSSSDSHLAVAEVGAGRVVWFAADWGGATCNDALLDALRMGSGVYADAAPRVDDLVFEGLRLVSLGGTVAPPFPSLEPLNITP